MPKYQYHVQFGSICIVGGGQVGIGELVTERSIPKPPIGFAPPQSPPATDAPAPAASDNGHKGDNRTEVSDDR